MTQNFACSSLTSYTYPVLLSTRTVVQDMYKHIPRHYVIYLGILHYLGTPWGGTAARTGYLGIPGMGTYARTDYLGIPWMGTYARTGYLGGYLQGPPGLCSWTYNLRYLGIICQKQVPVQRLKGFDTK